MKKRGKGIACIFYGTGYGNGFPDVSRAYARLLEDGRVEISVGATEVGQGAKTVMVQIAAETLGLLDKDIVLINEDTSKTPDAGTAAASRQTYNTGNAVKIACENLKEKILEDAAKLLGVNTKVGLCMKDGLIYVKSYPSKKVSLKEIAELNKDLQAEGVFTAHTTQMDENGQGAPYWPYTFASCAVEVEVDTETGEVSILRAKHVLDVGRAVNPSLVEGQIDGGFAMGVGYALMEDIGLKDGKMTNGSFEKYIIPTALDIPEIEKVLIEYPEDTAPYGAKGIGEPVMIPVAPAILNAIYDAIGVRFYEIPVTPERVLLALQSKG
ncbi:xanthine dehydrogenase family protein molybdopterin-binding subunit [Caloramator australicus]|uniref:Xanthine dehydrogenase, molybdenum binding subunit n=1 Tax=Caloramator australicus RC3 TaxID=857293 RepID=I7K6T8_9CLOT|nr:molybdopterin cofactor-binding domain-containing protein [Caloramator australicus]CCJ33254.1 Xanthine dehydrogenase, molybdenum binding subunit [Caloramator australicus RC3]